MKSIADLILDLQHATGHDRQLDIAISEVLGYKRHVKATMPGGREKVVWLYAVNGEESPNLPYFTAKIDAAQLLAKTLLPTCCGGCTWGPHKATAKIDDGPTFTSATPALALCAAALSAKFGGPTIEISRNADP